jgi:hypothetical protein
MICSFAEFDEEARKLLYVGVIPHLSRWRLDDRSRREFGIPCRIEYRTGPREQSYPLATSDNVSAMARSVGRIQAGA